MNRDLASALRPALVLTLAFAVLLGLAYPLLLTGIGQGLFPAQANGSLVRDAHGTVIGSELIGQGFASARYFHGRPSAAGKGWDATASGGSNLGPAAKALVDRVTADQKTLGKDAPADLLLASGSGLDPEISPAAARFQVARIAAARGMPVGVVEQIVANEARAPLLGFIGEPRVNVLALNRALDRAQSRP